MIQKKSLKDAIQNPEIISVVGGLLPEATAERSGKMSSDYYKRNQGIITGIDNKNVIRINKSTRLRIKIEGYASGGGDRYFYRILLLSLNNNILAVREKLNDKYYSLISVKEDDNYFYIISSFGTTMLIDISSNENANTTYYSASNVPESATLVEITDL